jgi:hypothetical protein
VRVVVAEQRAIPAAADNVTHPVLLG